MLEAPMFFFKKDTEPRTEYKQDSLPALIDFFESLKDEEDFPFMMAIDLFQKIDSAATSEEQLILFCLEDIIFSSLYSTIYEELIITCRDNPDVAIPLIEKFLQGAEDREQKIIIQAQQHLEYIQTG